MQHSLSHSTNLQKMSSPDFEIFLYIDQKNNNITDHFHDFFELQLLLEGSIKYQIENKVYFLNEGDLLLIPPSFNHYPLYDTYNGKNRKIALWFDCSYLQKIEDSLGIDLLNYLILPYHFHSNAKQPPRLEIARIHELLLQMIADEGIDLFSREALRQSQLSQLLILLINLSVSSTKSFVSLNNDQLVNDICDYIVCNLQNELSTHRIAEIFHFNVRTLERRFKRNLGISVAEYVKLTRMNISRCLLIEKITPSKASTMVGYSNYSTFYRNFLKHYGVSPKEYLMTTFD